MDPQILSDFEAEIRKLVPKFEVRFKNESKLQRVIGVLVWLFNRSYMTKFTTTLYPVVWFPSREYYESKPKSSLTILAHELVHLLDNQKHPIWFRLSYLFPQVLALLAFLAIVPVAILAGWWAFVPFITGLVLLVPWPAPWRIEWELRGYGMNLAVIQWDYGIVAEGMQDAIVEHFVTAEYYFMSWSRAATLRRLEEYTRLARDGSLQQQEPYRQVYDFLVRNKLTA